jgi:hypothetical protein
MAWATIDDVAAHMRISSDATMTRSLEEALAWATSKRPDLNPYVEQTPAIRKAVCIYAGLLYREGSSPQGIPGYQSEEGGSTDSTAYYRALDMLGAHRPVAR